MSKKTYDKEIAAFAAQVVESIVDFAKHDLEALAQKAQKSQVKNGHFFSNQSWLGDDTQPFTPGKDILARIQNITDLTNSDDFVAAISETITALLKENALKKNAQALLVQRVTSQETSLLEGIAKTIYDAAKGTQVNVGIKYTVEDIDTPYVDSTVYGTAPAFYKGTWITGGKERIALSDKPSQHRDVVSAFITSRVEETLKTQTPSTLTPLPTEQPVSSGNYGALIRQQQQQQRSSIQQL